MFYLRMLQQVFHCGYYLSYASFIICA